MAVEQSRREWEGLARGTIKTEEDEDAKKRQDLKALDEIIQQTKEGRDKQQEVKDQRKRKAEERLRKIRAKTETKAPEDTNDLLQRITAAAKKTAAIKKEPPLELPARQAPQHAHAGSHEENATTEKRKWYQQDRDYAQIPFTYSTTPPPTQPTQPNEPHMPRPGWHHGGSYQPAPQTYWQASYPAESTQYPQYADPYASQWSGASSGYHLPPQQAHPYASYYATPTHGYSESVQGYYATGPPSFTGSDSSAVQTPPPGTVPQQ